MKILIDAMGGDHAPLAPVQGALEAVKLWNANVVLVGREDEIRAAAKEAGYEIVEGEYLKTAKNAMVSRIYEKLGFEAHSDTQFIANTNTFVPNKTHIKEDI